MSPAPSIASVRSFTSLFVPSPHACSSSSLRTQKVPIDAGSTAAVRGSETPTIDGSHADFAPDDALAEAIGFGGGDPLGASLLSSLHALAPTTTTIEANAARASGRR